MNTPSVLVLIADDWSPIARCYDDSSVRTPRIDALAERSTVFTQAFCTTPSCAASRANLLTGLYSHQHGQFGHCHGVHHFQTYDHVDTLPAVLNRQGVFTGLIGKDHVAPASGYPFNVSAGNADAWDTGRLARRVKDFLAESSGRPFYLQAASTYPHRTGPVVSRGTCGFDVGVGDAAALETDFSYDPREISLPPWLPDLPEVRSDYANYLRFVSRFDRFVGTMLDALEASGRADDTRVVVMSDHGMPFPFAKGSCYDTGHHCPLIVYDPDQPIGRRCDALVNWSNLLPTFCDWFDVDPPEVCPERSIALLVDDPGCVGFERTFFSHSFHEVTNAQPYRAVRTRRHKLVRMLHAGLPAEGMMPSDLFDSPTWRAIRRGRPKLMGVRSSRLLLNPPPVALYDLEIDPWETSNRIDDPAYADIARTLADDLDSFRQGTNDPWLQWDHQTANAWRP